MCLMSKHDQNVKTLITFVLENILHYNTYIHTLFPTECELPNLVPVDW